MYPYLLFCIILIGWLSLAYTLKLFKTSPVLLIKNSKPRSITIITYNIDFFTIFLTLAFFILKSFIEGLYSSSFSFEPSISTLLLVSLEVSSNFSNCTSFLESVVSSDRSMKSSISSIWLETFSSASKSSVSISSSWFFITNPSFTVSKIIL